MQYNSTEIGIMEDIGIPYLKISPQNQLNIYFMTPRQYQLGIAKLRNVITSIINPSTKMI